MDKENIYNISYYIDSEESSFNHRAYSIEEVTLWLSGRIESYGSRLVVKSILLEQPLCSFCGKNDKHDFSYPHPGK